MLQVYSTSPVSHPEPGTARVSAVLSECRADGRRPPLARAPGKGAALSQAPITRSTLLLVLVLGLMLGSTRWLRLNLSGSVPSGVYRLRAVPVELHRGALVVLPVPANIRHLWPSWIPLLKPVAGLAGDVVCHQDGRLQVHGVDYGEVYLEAHGKALPHIDQGCQTVPEGCVFVASHAAKSLDGRYFGLTRVPMLIAEATPFLIGR